MKQCGMKLCWTFDNVFQLEKRKKNISCFVGSQNKEKIMSIAMGTMPCISQCQHIKGLGAPVALISLDSVEQNGKDEQNKRRYQKQIVLTYLCHTLKNKYFLDGFHYGADCIIYNGLNEKDHGTHIFNSYMLPEMIPCTNLVSMVRLANDVKKKLILILIKDTRMKLNVSLTQFNKKDIQCVYVERFL